MPRASISGSSKYPYNRIASAQYQLAMCSFKQIDSPAAPEHSESPGRVRALLSPISASPYADETREKIAACKDHLAEHEHLIGQFYKKGAYQAALSR
jgi:outer membrane protein assembly factor BamD (BamD/ComL family)